MEDILHLALLGNSTLPRGSNEIKYTEYIVSINKLDLIIPQ